MLDVNYENLLTVVKTMKISEISTETLEKICFFRADLLT
jgi:DNA-binding Xre family transcriptional regulator